MLQVMLASTALSLLPLLRLCRAQHELPPLERWEPGARDTRHVERSYHGCRHRDGAANDTTASWSGYPNTVGDDHEADAYYKVPSDKRVFVSLGWGPGGHKSSNDLGRIFYPIGDAATGGNIASEDVGVASGMSFGNPVMSALTAGKARKMAGIRGFRDMGDYAYQSDDAEEASYGGALTTKANHNKYNHLSVLEQVLEGGANARPKPPLYRPVRRPPAPLYPSKYGFVSPSSLAWRRRPSHPLNTVLSEGQPSSSKAGSNYDKKRHKLERLMKSLQLQKKYLYKIVQQKMRGIEALDAQPIDKLLQLLTHNSNQGKYPQE